MSGKLDAFFYPRNVALIGATDRPGSVGRAILTNLATPAFLRRVFAVNPARDNVMGLRSYPDVRSIPEPIDLAVIVTKAAKVPDVVADCAAANVPAAVIISAGFKEIGARGIALEQEIMARRGNMRIIGPNCLGLMNPNGGLNATFATTIARPGNIGFVSQSGALCTAILDWSLREVVGFSAFVSIGSMLDVGWGDLLRYLGDDPRTETIVLYMESVGDAHSFLSAAREVALRKPIVAIKPGRSEAGTKAILSHTGALAGSDEVLEAAFERCGVLRVDTIAELFYLSEALAKQPRPTGPRLTVVTNAGGPGVLATDALLAAGGQLAELSEPTKDALNAFLPRHWSHRNPIDILGDALPERYAKAIEIAAGDPNSDGLLVILAPQSFTDPAAVAAQLTSFARLPGKPVLASWMGGQAIEAGSNLLVRAGIPAYRYPDAAAKVFQFMWQYSRLLHALKESPNKSAEPPVPSEARALVDRVRASGRTLLTEAESKALLTAYGIPTVKTVVAATEDEAVDAAARIGYPVVVKLHSETLTHKTDVGGVVLNLKDGDAVRAAFRAIRSKVAAPDFLGVTVQPMIRAADAYELILGSSVDPQFGPVLLFGGGGQLVEVYRDRALALPPLNAILARRLMEKTKIFKALQGVRGRKPVDLSALDDLLVRFSQLVAGQRWIKEIDINPLLASAEGLVALDARVVLHSAETPERDLPSLALRPFSDAVPA